MKKTRTHGTWASDLSASRIARGGVRLDGVRANGAAEVVWWEGRPLEGGRGALVARADGVTRDLVGNQVNVRSRAHEYNGGAWTVLHDGVIAYVEATDQHVHLISGDDDRQLTDHDDDTRFGDLVDGGTVIFAVREQHGTGAVEPVNDLVAIDRSTGQIEIIASGRDFYSSPRPHPSQPMLAYLCWDHPNMPWDDTELRLVDWSAGVEPENDRAVLVGASTQQPLWHRDELIAISDPDGWWVPVRVDLAGGAQPLLRGLHEVGVPPWAFGMSSMAIVSDRLVVVEQHDGVGRLNLVEDGDLVPIPTDFTEFGPLAVDGDHLLVVAAQPTVPDQVVRIALDGSTEVLRAATAPLSAADISHPIHLKIGDGPTAPRALYYPPASSTHDGPPGDAPPLLLLSHGGPTGAARAGFNASVQFWTNRGFAVVDVNYRGSTGYGRAMRDALAGQWGVADVQDCIDTARSLVADGLADGDRLFIKGGSAGGYTTLCALTFHDVFAAGASRYGIGDLATLARDTHKFESRYLDGLVGRWPEDADVYTARSPINFTELLATPMLILQGGIDPVVPPNQAEAMVEALDRASVMHAYLLFPEESHGFKQADNIEAALEAEYVFFCRVAEMEPHGGGTLDISHG